MRYEESKDKTNTFKKVETNVMFTKKSTKDVIKKIGEKAVSAMIKEFR